ncbi:hypothetical protein [Actinomadura sp. HBU206391]|uniref:RIFT barrel domain-containing protein n=1 Tax=Actinomadura sp. HBU206391 TaxID=2731692 RepID=UPI003967AE8E
MNRSTGLATRGATPARPRPSTHVPCTFIHARRCVDHVRRQPTKRSQRNGRRSGGAARVPPRYWPDGSLKWSAHAVAPGASAAESAARPSAR